jgi:hypothetical protein
MATTKEKLKAPKEGNDQRKGMTIIKEQFYLNLLD